MVTSLVLGLLVLLTPYALSLGYLRSRVQTEMNNNLRGKCEVADVSFSWFSGVSVTELRVANPPGFTTERPAMTIKGMKADVSLPTLLTGAILADATIDGLEVNVEQNADGTTNLQQLAPEPEAPAESPAEPETPEPPTSGTTGADGIGFTFKLTNCKVSIRREGKLLEELSDFGCTAQSPLDSGNITVDANGKLQAGDLAVKLLIDPTADTTNAQLTTHGLDLNSWRPLIDVFMPDQITALTGKVNGDITATKSGNDKVQLGGELIIDDPRIAGPIVQEMDLRSTQWKITPALLLGEGAPSDVDASKFALDLEWLHINGQPATAKGQVTLGYDIDLAKLAEFGGPIPEMLKGTGSLLTGVISLPSTDLPADAAGWAEVLIANASLQVKTMDVAGFALRDIGLDLVMKDGAVSLITTPASKLDGGALAANISINLKDFGKMPMTASLKWNGGKLTGGATQALRYVMPLFAGLDPDTARVIGDVNLDLNFNGPAMMQENQTLLGWLDAWTGDGSLGLANTAFAPSKELEGLLAPLGPLTKNAVPVGENGRLKVDSFNAPFAFAKGIITSKSSEWSAAGQKIGLSGNIGFDGKMDYAMDLSALLKGRKDGEKVLKALKGKLPPANLTGSLDAPKLGLPDLEEIAKSLIQDQGADLLKKGLEGLFKK